MTIELILLLAGAGFWGGAQNTVAGGGSFIVFPTLLLAGLNPLAANVTSSIALFPGLVAASASGRALVGGAGRLSFRQLFAISAVGGLLGAILLLVTPADFFARLVPWLMLFATGVFSWGSFRKKPLEVSGQVSAPVLALIQGCIAVYGGYFGGGIGFLMLAALTVAGQQVRTASATKNALAMSMTATAFVVFAFSDHVHWLAALTLGAGATAGGLCGTYLQRWMPERILRAIVVLIGCALTVWMFVRP
jgi:uncharacterized membrane protein YfcA